MHTISNNLKNHIAGQVTTLARLWKMTRIDDVVMGYTDHSRDILYDGVTYESRTGFDGTSLQSRSDLSVNNLEVKSFFSNEKMTEEDLKAGLYDYARLDLFVVNYQNLADGHIHLGRHTLGQVRYDLYGFSVELRGLLHTLETNIGRIISPACDAILGDGRCKVNLASFTFSATVTSVFDKRNFTATALTQASQYFTAGEVGWTSGDNDGVKMEIKGHNIGGKISLVLPMAKDIQVGDSFNIVAGCDKTSAKCKNTFSNLINFRGFETVIGYDELLKTAGTFK